MATYDFAWLWRELKLEHLRRKIISSAHPRS